MSKTIVGSRADLHRRLAKGYVEGYRDGLDRGYFTNGGEWKYSEDAVFTCGPFSDTSTDLPELQIGKILKDLAESGEGAHGIDGEETSNIELKVWWTVLPDYRLLTNRTFVDDESFIMWSTFGGHASDGTFITLVEVDYIETNEAGEITRWDALLGYRGWDSMVKALTGKSVDEFSLMDYMAVIMERGAAMGAV